MHPTTFYLVRHGEKERHPGDPGLTDLGKLQASQTARFLRERQVHRILVSPLKRTQQTALPIAEALGLEMQLDERLRERSNWTGEVDFADFLKDWIQASKHRDALPASGVSSQQAGNRFLQVLVEAASDDSVQSVVCVSHAGSITDLLRNIFSEEVLLSQYFKELERLYRTDIPHCSITELEVSENGVTLIRIASDDHLYIE